MSVLFSALEKSRQARAAGGDESGASGATPSDGEATGAAAATETAGEAGAETLPLRTAPGGRQSGVAGAPGAGASADDRVAYGRTSAGARTQPHSGTPERDRADTAASEASNGGRSLAELYGEPARRPWRTPRRVLVLGVLAGAAVLGWQMLAPGGVERLQSLGGRVVSKEPYAGAVAWTSATAQRGVALLQDVVPGIDRAAAPNDDGTTVAVPEPEGMPSGTGTAASAEGRATGSAEAPEMAAEPPAAESDSGTGSADEAVEQTVAPNKTAAADGNAQGVTSEGAQPTGAGPDEPVQGTQDTDAATGTAASGPVDAPARTVAPLPETAPQIARAGSQPAPPPKPEAKPAAIRTAASRGTGEPSGTDPAASGEATQTARAPSPSVAGDAETKPVPAPAEATSDGGPSAPSPGEGADTEGRGAAAASGEDSGVSLSVQTPAGTALNATDHRAAARALRTGDSDRAARLYLEILESSPGNPDALAGLGRALTKMGMLRQARETYRRLIQVEPGNEAALSRLISLAARGEPEDAVARLQALADARPGFAPIHAQLAEVHSRAGDREAAIQAMRKAVEAAPRSLRFRYNLAVLYDRAGQARAAVEAYRQVLAQVRQTGRRDELPVDAVRRRLRYLGG